MDAPLVVIAGIIALGLFFVVLPVAYDAYTQYRRTKVVTCPQEQGPAEISFDAPRAALGTALGTATLRIKSCSLWPRRANCAQQCVK